MHQLSQTGKEAIDKIARDTGFSAGAVETMLQAIARGGGRMAQFSHSEFGGSGQWMAGGMTMVGDMFNDQLKGRVNQLGHALAGFIDEPRNFDAAAGASARDEADDDRKTMRSDDAHSARTAGSGHSASWWPAALGSPSSTGSQNAMRYAYFPDKRRLVLDNAGVITIYDTLDHDIGGFSQQQSSDSSIKLSSQHGPIDVAKLPVVSR